MTLMPFQVPCQILSKHKRAIPLSGRVQEHDPDNLREHSSGLAGGEVKYPFELVSVCYILVTCYKPLFREVRPSDDRGNCGVIILN